MAKDESTDIQSTEVLPENASDHPVMCTYASAQDQLPQWPVKPHPLTKESKTERMMDAFDMALIFISLALIAKAILCIVAAQIDKYNRGFWVDEASYLSVYLIRFNKQMTTVFTIIFSLIVTTLVRRVALYRAQEGSATVAELEQYQASTSLPGSLKAMWSLQSFSWVSLYLISIWSWYYLGSQATTHEYAYDLCGHKSHFPVGYPGPETPSEFAGLKGAAPSNVLVSNVNAAFIAATSVVPGNPATDINGAAVAPMWGSNQESSSLYNKLPLSRHGWWDVSKASKIIWSSSIGSPLTWISEDPTDAGSHTGGLVGNYAANTTYFNVSCATPILQTANEYPNHTLAGATVALNVTSNTTSSDMLNNNDPPSSFKLWYRVNDTSKTLSASCEIRTVFVEMKIKCTGIFCAAKKARLTRGADLPVNRTPFDDSEFASVFFDQLVLSNGVPSPYEANVPFSIIADTVVNSFGEYVGFLTQPSENPWPAASFDYYGRLDLDYYLTPIINTYYQASLAPPPKNINDTISGKATSTAYSRTNFHGAPYKPQYHLSWPWVIVDLISCKLLLISAVHAFRIRKKTIAPDIFGYVSSLTRDNPDMSLPDGGSTLSGFERARLLKNVKIKIADLHVEGEVGRIGLVHAGHAGQRGDVMFKKRANDGLIWSLGVGSQLILAGERSRETLLAKKWKPRLAGKEIIVRDQLDKLVKAVQVFKDLVTAAAGLDPLHTHLLATGICLIMQLATNDSDQYATMIAGAQEVFTLTSRYNEIEVLYVACDETMLKQEFETCLIALYKHITKHQVTAACYSRRNTTIRFLRSMHKLDEPSAVLVLYYNHRARGS